MVGSSATPAPPVDDPIRAAVAVVGPGEWTSYGEVSMLVFGHRGAARAVGRWLSRDSDSNAHRVLQVGGRIAPGWGGGGDGPARCRALLQVEGVEFAGDAAHPRCRMAWGDLAARLGPGRRRHTPQ